MVNYAEGIFTIEYEEDNKKYYATFHPEVIEGKDANALTSRWLIVLLHPDEGLQTFYLTKNNLMDRWEMNQDSTVILEDEFLQWCGEQIVKRRPLAV